MTTRVVRVVAPLLAIAWASLACARLQEPTPDGVGSRASAMGGAYVAIAEGAAGTFHNPAGLGVGSGVHFFGQTNVVARDEVKLDPKGATYRWREWGIGWGNRLAQHEDGLADYTYISGGHRLSAHVAAGVSVKLWRTHPSRHFDVLGSSATYDIGLLVAPSGMVRLGARLGQHERGGRLGHAVVGASHRFGRVLVAADAEWRSRDRSMARIGLEVRAFASVQFRGGWSRDGLSAGGGIDVGPVTIDASWATVADHRTVTVGAEVRM